jgi:KDO2-lipid IV(A) lauroyltransferase
VERVASGRFRVVFEKPLELPRSGDRTADVLALMTAINLTIEGWIRAHPEDWLWLHRRWPKELTG